MNRSRMTICLFESDNDIREVTPECAVLKNYISDGCPQWVCVFKMDNGYDYDDVELHSLNDLTGNPDKMLALIEKCTVLYCIEANKRPIS